MKTIKMPTYLHDVFGEEITAAELWMILTVSTGTTMTLFAFTQDEWSLLPLWKIVPLFLLIFDIMAGFIANLTFSTNNFYRDRPKNRLVFIILHIQPLIFSFLMNGYLLACFVIWVHTLVSALLVNRMQKYPAQKPLAGGLVAIGLLVLLLNSAALPLLLIFSLAFFQLKVIYSFAVDHHALREI
jgi:hypothetical protein